MSKVETILKELKDLTLLEASELVKGIEETFGVSASAAPAMMMAGPVAAAGVAAEEKTEFTVEIAAVPADAKIAVIKAVKNILNVGLTDAKAMVEGAPVVVKEGVKKEEAEAMKAELSAAGATVNLK